MVYSIVTKYLVWVGQIGGFHLVMYTVVFYQRELKLWIQDFERDRDDYGYVLKNYSCVTF